MTSRVLILSHQIPYFPGPGAETRAFCLSKVLSKSHDITFLLPDYGPTQRSHYEALRAIGDVEIFKVEKQWKRLEWRLRRARNYLGESRLLQIFDETPDMLRLVDDLVTPLSEHLRQVDWRRFDLLHIIHPQFAGPIQGMSIPIQKTLDWVDERTIVHRRQLGTSRSLLSDIVIRKEIKNIERYQRRIIPMFDTSFVASAVDAERLEQSTGGKRPMVVPNGVETEYFVNHTPERPSGNTLIFTGHMGYKPNEDAVLHFVRQILPTIRNYIPEVRLIVVGMQPSAAIKELQDEYPQVVEVTGEVPDVRPYLAKGVLSIVPLLSGGGTRLKLLEAMAMRRPVVTTTIGCEGLAIQNDYHAIVRDDAADFATAIIQVLQNQALWSRLANNGYGLVAKEYGWQKAAEPILEVWNCLAARCLPSYNYQN